MPSRPDYRRVIYADVFATLWYCIGLQPGYQQAIEGYWTVTGGSDRHRESRSTDSKKYHVQAGDGIKNYLKDLWMAFILVVSDVEVYVGRLVTTVHHPDTNCTYVCRAIACVQNALLISASVTPFAQAAQNTSVAKDRQDTLGALLPAQNDCSGWTCDYNHQLYGAVWSFTLTLNCLAMLVSMLLMGYMLSVPNADMYMWASGRIRWLGLPALTTVLGTVVFMLAVSYSAGVFYGTNIYTAALFMFIGTVITGLVLVRACAPSNTCWEPDTAANTQGTQTGDADDAAQRIILVGGTVTELSVDIPSRGLSETSRVGSLVTPAQSQSEMDRPTPFARAASTELTQRRRS